MNQENTIAAISTGKGGAVSIVRISGKQAFAICDRIFRSKSGKRVIEQKAFTVRYGTIVDEREITIDEVLLTVFKAPFSYTGEDMAEIACHGSSYIEQSILRLLVENGADIAGAGEFTMRAFLNGKLDLVQAEAVADLIASDGAASHRIAMNQMRGGYSSELGELREQLLHLASLLELELDFSEEDVQFADRKLLLELVNRVQEKTVELLASFRLGNAIKNGVPVAIIGRPNAGKSTLLNALLKEDRAIVSDIAGTTRDVIEETVTLDGILYRFIDTAGIRDTDDVLETLGIERTMERVKKAQVVLFLADCRTDSASLETDLDHIGFTDGQNVYIVLTKSDLADADNVRSLAEELGHKTGKTAISLSVKTGEGLPRLVQLIGSGFTDAVSNTDQVLISNTRHYQLLGDASKSLERARQGLVTGLPTDLVAQDVREVIRILGSITGDIQTDDILGTIFSKFCIGK